MRFLLMVRFFSKHILRVCWEMISKALRFIIYFKNVTFENLLARYYIENDA